MARFFSLRGSAAHSFAFTALGDFGLDPSTFGVVGGSLVKLDFDEEEEFCEVGSWPAFDGRSQSLWNHCSKFTS